MHDPMIQAFQIPYPWWTRNKFDGSRYHKPFITIWHVDPEKDGTDDSCGWFQRARHGDPAVLLRIQKRLDDDWDRVWHSRKEDHLGQDKGPITATYFRGYFLPNGEPHFSVSGIVLNCIFIAAMEHFKSDGTSNWKDANAFMQKNLFRILLLAENPVDSLFDAITNTFRSKAKREQRIGEMAEIVYGWVLRETRPWYRHPRWHIRHWRIQCHPLQSLKRTLFTRCSKCGGWFKLGESCVSGQWDSPGPQWFRSERGVMHDRCGGITGPSQEKSC